MSNIALAAQRQNDLAMTTVPKSLEDWWKRAQAIAESGLCPKELKGKPKDVLIVLTKGAELGLWPQQSMESIDVIYDRPFVRAKALHALVLKSALAEYFIRVESTPSSCTWETKRVGDPEPTRETYTLQDAKDAGLISRSDAWKKSPGVMCSHRARARLANTVYPDVTLGVYISEEADDFDQQEAIHVVAEVIEEEAAPASKIDALAKKLSKPEILPADEDDSDAVEEANAELTEAVDAVDKRIAQEAEEEAEAAPEEPIEVEAVESDPEDEVEAVEDEEGAIEFLSGKQAEQLERMVKENGKSDVVTAYLQAMWGATAWSQVPVTDYEKALKWIYQGEK